MKLNPCSQQPPPRRKLVSGAFSIAALLMATSAVYAHEWQGKMPKPVQPLPKYPPVVCVEPDWATASCADRRAAQQWEEWQEAKKKADQQAEEEKRQRQIELENKHSGATTVLYHEWGGDLREHEARWKTLAESGDDVEVRGWCVSGCTMIMAYVPKSRICFAWGSSLRFHQARAGITVETATPSNSTTQYMLNKYPLDIKTWLEKRGGVQEMTVEKFWVLDATELWEMGYRKCGPEAYPVPMTKLSESSPPWPWVSPDKVQKVSEQ
jgi:hypothetical protein